MTDTLLSQFYLKLNGANAAVPLIDAVEEVTVESSLHLPDVLTVVIYDPKLKWVDDRSLQLGTPITASFGTEAGTAQVFDGEIVEVELELEAGVGRTIVRAFDRLHRLARSAQAHALLNVTDGDLVSRVAGAHGLQASTPDPGGVMPYMLQAGDTDLVFLQRRAVARGCLLFVNGTQLHFKAPGSPARTVTLKSPRDLLRFKARASTLGQVQKVTVRGWDMRQKQAVMGASSSSTVIPKVGAQPRRWFGSDEVELYDCTLTSQAQAETVAKATLLRHASGFVEAEGVARGNPQIVAGAAVKVEHVGTTFSGTYFVTTATHRYRPGEPYTVEFSVSGVNPVSLLASLLPETASADPGLVPAVITNAQDPDNLGRVKVKLAWLGESIESDWVRMVVPGGGNQRGFQWMPEVNDEVLVGFTHGDLNMPYVIGGLWNGQDKPATTSFLKSNKVATRTLRSREGHEITVDDDPGAGGITIKDKDGNEIVIKTKDKAVTITSLGDLTLSAKGEIKLAAQKAIAVEAQGALRLKSQQTIGIKASQDVQVEATASTTLKGSAGVTVDGTAQLQLKGANVKVEGSAMVQVQGGVIKLN